MIEVRIHGRGGQGVVTAAELIAVAAFYDKKFSQAFPSFGVERRGAPIEAYARIDEKFVRTREQVYLPDYIIVQDPTLIEVIDVFKGAKKETKVLINSEKSPNIFKAQAGGLEVFCVPALQIALKILKKPIINTAILGSFAGVSGLINPRSIQKAIEERFENVLAKQNIKAMNIAYCHSNPGDKYCFRNGKPKVALDSGQKFGANS